MRTVKKMDHDLDPARKSGVNGFSGGEEATNQQLLLLNPKQHFWTTDSGPTSTPSKCRRRGKQYRSQSNGVVLITHYQRLLDYIVPDYVHVLSNGLIIESGDKGLALELEAKGYAWLT